MEFHHLLALLGLLALAVYLVMLLLISTAKPVESVKLINATEYLNKMPTIRTMYQINIDRSNTDPAMEPRNMRY